MKATVIIPAYEPDENLIGIVGSVRALGNQVLVVDDGSDENKQHIFQKLAENATVIHHEKNMGKGAAIKSALAYIRENMKDCEIIGVMDADGQHLPEDMTKLIAAARHERTSMILGVRQVGKEMPLKSRMGNGITRTIFHLLSGVKISDTQTGLRAFSSVMIDRLLTVEGSRYEYETNALFYCAKENISIVEIPIETIYHDKENSCSHFHVIRDSFRIYKDIIKFTASSMSGFLLDYLVFCILALIFPGGATFVLLANVLARIISAGFNYYVNCRFVFHRGARPQTAVQYFLLALGILIFNSIILGFYSGICGMPLYGAKVLTEVTLFVISFAVQRLVIFRAVAQ